MLLQLDFEFFAKTPPIGFHIHITLPTQRPVCSPGAQEHNYTKARRVLGARDH